MKYITQLELYANEVPNFPHEDLEIDYTEDNGNITAHLYWTDNGAVKSRVLCSLNKYMFGKWVFTNSAERHVKNLVRMIIEDRFIPEQKEPKTPTVQMKVKTEYRLRETVTLWNDGKEVKVNNVSSFCRTNHLSESHISYVISGKMLQHKGWCLASRQEEMLLWRASQMSSVEELLNTTEKLQDDAKDCLERLLEAQSEREEADLERMIKREQDKVEMAKKKQELIAFRETLDKDDKQGREEVRKQLRAIYERERNDRLLLKREEAVALRKENARAKENARIERVKERIASLERTKQIATEKKEEGHRYGRRTYVFMKEQQEVVVTNLRKFCEDNGLSYNGMRCVADKRQLCFAGYYHPDTPYSPRFNVAGGHTYRVYDLLFQGYPVEIQCVEKYCKERSLSVSRMYQLIAGKRPHYAGYHLPGTPVPKIRGATIFLQKDGELYTVSNRKEFAEQYGLSTSSINRLATGACDCISGWTLCS